jgi:hypothetical protein
MSASFASYERKKRTRREKLATNIGKPVITIDNDTGKRGTISTGTPYDLPIFWRLLGCISASA